MLFRSRLIRLAVLASLGVWSQGASAGGFALIEQNASGVGNAYAGQAAAAENASTIFFNPSGMTLVPGRQVTGTLNIIRPQTEFTDNGGSRSPANVAAPGGGSNGNDAGGWNYVPNAFMSWQFSDRLWAGIGLTVPFGLKTNYDPTFIGRFQSQKSQLVTYDINPSVAFKVNDWLSLGGGISYQYARLGLDRSFFAGATRAQTVSLHDGAWGWNAGAMLNLGKDTRVGLTYRSTINLRSGRRHHRGCHRHGDRQGFAQHAGFGVARHFAPVQRKVATARRRDLDALEPHPEPAVVSHFSAQIGRAHV